jgi:uncharacterized membrane protein
MRRYTKAGSIVSIAIALLVVLCLVVLIRETADRYPTNHIGFDIRWLLYLSGFGAAWCVPAWKFHWGPTRLVVAALGACLLLVATIILMDRLNLMIEYSAWISRGMPGPFEPSQYR